MNESRSHQHLLVQNGTLVTMDSARRVFPGDVLISNGQIVSVGDVGGIPPATRLLDATGQFVLPGFIQAHVHLGQSLFKGLAEGLELLEWLEDKVWPLEAAHTEDSAYWSTRLGAADCLLSGTTTVQEMGLVREMNGVFRGIVDSGVRAVAGKCLMDMGNGVPARLVEDSGSAIRDAAALVSEWGGEARGRITGSVCPRFLLSCSRALWERVVDLARNTGTPVHTHLLESEREEAAVREEFGEGQMEVLDRLGVFDTDLRVAHGVLLDKPRLERLRGRTLRVAHCPTANAKLGSGTADLGLLKNHEDVALGIGCDGGPCNNDLDVIEEMRTAALLQSLKYGPTQSIGALDTVEMATIGGAAAVGLESQLGSLEPGKLGDLVVLDLNRPASFGGQETSVYDRLVYGAGRDAVSWVVVDGEVVVENGKFEHHDLDEIRRRPAEELAFLLGRAELN